MTSSYSKTFVFVRPDENEKHAFSRIFTLRYFMGCFSCCNEKSLLLLRILVQFAILIEFFLAVFAISSIHFCGASQICWQIFAAACNPC